jgi:hypothetical protein
LGWRCPRHFVPGYDRTVPPGHFATGTLWNGSFEGRFPRRFVPGRLRRLRRARQPRVCATTFCGRDVGLRRAQSSRFAESGYDRTVPPGRACSHFATATGR